MQLSFRFYKHPESPFCSIAFDLTKLGLNFGTNYTVSGKVITSEGHFNNCSPEQIRRTYLNSTLTYVDWVTRINVPQSQDVCPFPCDYWEHSTSVIRNSDSFAVTKPNSLVKITRTGMNPQVTEVQRLGWLDILSLAGGAMGMWAGGSFITVIQLSAGSGALLLALIQRPNQSDKKKNVGTILDSSLKESTL